MFALNHSKHTVKKTSSLMLKVPVVITFALAMFVLSFQHYVVGDHQYQNAPVAVDVAGFDEADPQDIDPGFPTKEFSPGYNYSNTSTSPHYQQLILSAVSNGASLIRGPPVLI